MFTVNKLGLPKRVCCGLTTTNIIESSLSRIKIWQDVSMVKR